jgi:hypothetical protein
VRLLDRSMAQKIKKSDRRSTKHSFRTFQHVVAPSTSPSSLLSTTPTTINERVKETLRAIFNVLVPFSYDQQARWLFLLTLHRPLSTNSHNNDNVGLIVSRHQLFDASLASLIWRYMCPCESHLDHRSLSIWWQLRSSSSTLSPLLSNSSFTPRAGTIPAFVAKPLSTLTLSQFLDYYEREQSRYNRTTASSSLSHSLFPEFHTFGYNDALILTEKRSTIDHRLRVAARRYDDTHRAL